MIGLLFISGRFEGTGFSLKENWKLSFGRAEGVDIVLDEDQVSRKHAQLKVFSDHLYIEDLGSTNGTFANGEKITEVKLAKEDRILIGTSIMKIVAGNDERIHQIQNPNEINNILKEAAENSNIHESSMSGDLSDVPLPDLLQLFASNEKSGVLYLTGEQNGKIYLKKGQVLYTTIDGHKSMPPMKCLCRMFGWENVQFSLNESEQFGNFDNPFTLPTSSLLMDAVRQHDEYNHLKNTQLPSLQTPLTMAIPLIPALKELNANELEVLQLALNFNILDLIIDRARMSDLDVANAIQKLLKKGYLEISEQ